MKDPLYGAIFDMDGVIVDTGWAHKQAWAEFARMYGAEFTDETFFRTFGMQNYQIIPIVLGHNVSPDEIGPMGDWKEQRYREIVSKNLMVPDGLVALLEDLEVHGFRIAVGSSAPKINIDLVLEALQPFHQDLKIVAVESTYNSGTHAVGGLLD